MMKCVYLLFFAATFVAVGCSGSVTGPSDVSGDTWQLVSLQQGSSAPVTVSDPSRYTMRLTANGRVEVKSDCNACGGSYALSGDSFDVGPMACTRAFCGTASLDAAFAGALDGAQSLTQADNRLTITGGDVTLRFRR